MPLPETSQVDSLVDNLFRDQASHMVAILTRIFGATSLQLAEDVVQDALITALKVWPYRGIPDNPRAWLIRAARNRALDVLRREKSLQDITALLERLDEAPPESDDRLTLMFLCCYPSLTQEAQIALTLKVVSAFSVTEIARAFLTTPDSIEQRLARAKRRLRESGADFALPPPGDLADRLDSVLAVLYLLFNEGYSASEGDDLIRHDLCAEALRLLQLLVALPPGDSPPAHALLAFLFFQASRFPARLDSSGDMVLLGDQDRTLWDRRLIDAGYYHLQCAMSGDTLTEYHLLAGIASCHAAAPDEPSTDWASIRHYYDQLVERFPSPVYALNRAVATAMLDGPQAGLDALAALEGDPRLTHYVWLPAAMGDLTERINQPARAAEYYRRALDLTRTSVDKRFLEKRLARCTNDHTTNSPSLSDGEGARG